jgi:Calcineurin-like phosphoesterase
MVKALTWLHLSDIHFLPKKAWRDNDSRQQFLDFLKNIFKEDKSNVPALIFCTGDIAFGETSGGKLIDQYTNAKEFFDNLLAVCGSNGISLPKERLFVVPGNHDVNRETINGDAQSTLYQWAKQSEQHVEKINQRFADRSTEFRDAVARLREYETFIKAYLPHQFEDDGRQYYCRKVTVEGVVCGIAGLNSAWSCAGPEDDRNIWLAAQWQFNMARDLLNDSAIKIGLIHHPVDWFNVSDRDHATRAIASDFDFWLHGHSHNTWVSPTQSHVQIGAGAVGASHTDEFGVNLVKFQVESRKGAVYLYNKRSGSSGWTIAPIATHAPKGEWPFILPSKGAVPGGSSSSTNAISEAGTRVNKKDETASKLSGRLGKALSAFHSQPKVWIAPILNKQPETAKEKFPDAVVSIPTVV